MREFHLAGMQARGVAPGRAGAMSTGDPRAGPGFRPRDRDLGSPGKY